MYYIYPQLKKSRFRALGICFLFSVFCLINIPGQDLKNSMMGEWRMVSNGDGFLEATLHFDESDNYWLDRTWPDGSKAEVKGGCELNAANEPATLRLCLGDCNTAGSEWTSMFCLVRLEGNDRLEIIISGSGDFPGEFPADPDSKGMYIFERAD